MGTTQFEIVVRDHDASEGIGDGDQHASQECGDGGQAFEIVARDQRASQERGDGGQAYGETVVHDQDAFQECGDGDHGEYAVSVPEVERQDKTREVKNTEALVEG